uniref:Secreted protein n=1 Tax=Cacopsylla melanoneura TaxID=428564 RepID=A0A8D8ZPU7_9HEMI
MEIVFMLLFWEFSVVSCLTETTLFTEFLKLLLTLVLRCCISTVMLRTICLALIFPIVSTPVRLTSLIGPVLGRACVSKECARVMPCSRVRRATRPSVQTIVPILMGCARLSFIGASAWTNTRVTIARKCRIAGTGNTSHSVTGTSYRRGVPRIPRACGETRCTSSEAKPGLVAREVVKAYLRRICP